MAEYINRKKLIKRLHNAEENYKADHDYDIDNDPFSDGILSAMFSVNQMVGSQPTEDVVEREKIDKFIEELKGCYPKNAYGELELGGTSVVFSLNQVLDILKGSIVESK